MHRKKASGEIPGIRGANGQRELMPIVAGVLLFCGIAWALLAKLGGTVGIGIAVLPLWWSTLCVASLLALGHSDLRTWPRGYSARLLVFFNASVVGSWIGFTDATPLVLAVLPVYGTGEHGLLQRFIPPVGRSVYMPLAIRFACLLAGELVGFVAIMLLRRLLF